MVNEPVHPDIARKLKAAGEPKSPPKLDGYSIYRTNYPPPVFLFAGLLAVGLTILAGRPKSGKSWLTLQMAIDAADGSANESLIRSLTGVERILRETESNRVLVTAYDAFHQNMPSLTGELVAYGERLRYERQAALMAFIDLMAEPEDRW